jgi:hypothetical protein
MSETRKRKKGNLDEREDRSQRGGTDNEEILVL